MYNVDKLASFISDQGGNMIEVIVLNEWEYIRRLLPIGNLFMP